MLISTMSVREYTEADDKYSSVISAPFPLSILTWLFGGIVFGVKSERFNIAILIIYYMPVAIICFILFVGYSFLIIPLCYIKMAFHKFALIFKAPSGGRKALDRTLWAIFFSIFGIIILTLDSIVDIFWFLRHMFTLQLDKSNS